MTFANAGEAISNGNWNLGRCPTGWVLLLETWVSLWVACFLSGMGKELAPWCVQTNKLALSSSFACVVAWLWKGGCDENIASKGGVKSYTSELLSWCDANILWRQQFFWCSKVFSWCSNSFPGAAKFSGSELWFSGFQESPESFPSWRQWFFLHGSCICIVACEKCDFSAWRRSFLESKLASLL